MNQILKNEKIRKVEETGKAVAKKGVKAFRTKPYLYALALLFAFLLIMSVLLDSFVMPFVAGKYAHTGTVPSVEGLAPKDAERVLDSAGFDYEWTSEGSFSTSVPEGKVANQVPAPGRTAKYSRSVRLTVSKGIRGVAVPELHGKTLHQTAVALRKAGLVEGEVIDSAFASVPKGVVICTDPIGGRMVHVGDTVTVIVSSGKSESGMAQLPVLEKLSLKQAQHVLDSLGLELGEVRREHRTEGLSGTVVKQLPRAFSYVPAGTKINLTVIE